jgi:hypothetical protein
VFAVAPTAVAFSNYLDTLCKNVVPFVGWATNSGFCGNAIGFGISGCLTPPTGGRKFIATGSAASIAGSGSKTLALVGEDNDSSRQGSAAIGAAFNAIGFRTAYSTSIVPVTGLTDATPIVNAIMTADHGKPVGAVYSVVQIGSALKLLGALKAAGYKGVLVTPYYDPRLAGVGEFAGTYAVLQWQPGISTNVPAIAQMVADFKKYAPGETLSLTSMAGYWSADMVIKGLQKTGRNLTVDSFLKTMNSNYSNYVPGALPETRWPLNHVATTPCGTLAHLTNKTWTAPPESCTAIVAQ